MRRERHGEGVLEASELAPVHVGFYFGITYLVSFPYSPVEHLELFPGSACSLFREYAWTH